MKIEKKYFFDKPKNVKYFFRGFWIWLIFLLTIDFFIYKHPITPWEGWPEFYATYGFVSCVCLVLAAKYILRPLVKRKENYYD